MKIVAHFDIPYYQVLDEKSHIVADLPPFSADRSHLLRLYQQMVLNRLFDAKAIALQRTGKMGTYPSTRGQEAVFVGVGDALEVQDLFVPYYRDVGILIQRGVALSEILLYWGGDERGNCFAENSQDFPFNVPIATQSLHAAGIATAIDIRQEKRAVLTMCGDGGTSEGDFYEAMNIAGIWNLPLVFVINNNQWAISVARSAQTASQTLAQKAIAAGFLGEQVDGNDVIAVRYRVAEALTRARDGKGPTLIELLTYRQGDHTTADDASRYEPQGLREREWLKEPIKRLRYYLEANHVWDEQQEAEWQQHCVSHIEQEVDCYLAMPQAAPHTMFDHLYATLPSIYQEQRAELIAREKKEGVAHG